MSLSSQPGDADFIGEIDFLNIGDSSRRASNDNSARNSPSQEVGASPVTQTNEQSGRLSFKLYDKGGLLSANEEGVERTNAAAARIQKYVRRRLARKFVRSEMPRLLTRRALHEHVTLVNQLTDFAWRLGPRASLEERREAAQGLFELLKTVRSDQEVAISRAMAASDLPAHLVKLAGFEVHAKASHQAALCLATMTNLASIGTSIELAQAGALPVLVNALMSSDPPTVYYGTACLQNIMAEPDVLESYEFMAILAASEVESRLEALAAVPNPHMASVAAGALANVKQSPQRAQMRAATLIQAHMRGSISRINSGAGKISPPPIPEESELDEVASASAAEQVDQRAAVVAAAQSEVDQRAAVAAAANAEVEAKVGQRAAVAAAAKAEAEADDASLVEADAPAAAPIDQRAAVADVAKADAEAEHHHAAMATKLADIERERVATIAAERIAILAAEAEAVKLAQVVRDEKSAADQRAAVAAVEARAEVARDAKAAADQCAAVAATAQAEVVAKYLMAQAVDRAAEAAALSHTLALQAVAFAQEATDGIAAASSEKNPVKRDALRATARRSARQSSGAATGSALAARVAEEASIEALRQQHAAASRMQAAIRGYASRRERGNRQETREAVLRVESSEHKTLALEVRLAQLRRDALRARVEQTGGDLSEDERHKFVAMLLLASLRRMIAARERAFAIYIGEMDAAAASVSAELRLEKGPSALRPLLPPAQVAAARPRPKARAPTIFVRELVSIHFVV